MSSTEMPAPGAPQLSGPASTGRALHVAVVTETYPPEVNGVSMTLARLVGGLRARGHRVSVVRPRQGHEAGHASGAADAAEVLVSGWPIPQYPHLRLGLPAGALLRRLWRRERPDVVHVATEGPLGFSAVHAARHLALPATSDFRTNFHAYAGHYGMAWLERPLLAYLRAFHNRTAATMVPTEALRRRLHAEGFHRLSVVSRGVDTGRFDPALRSEALRREWGAAADQPVLLYVGRLAAEKNLGLLVRTFRAVHAAMPRARLVLVGDGPLRAWLQSELPPAHFAGLRHGADLAAHYASADLFLFPSLTETFGNVVAEAMASGLAVVAFDHAAAAQLVEPGQSGVVVACDNALQFEGSAVALASSRVARTAMGLRARRRASAQGWDSVIDAFEAVLHQAMRGHAGPGGARPECAALHPPLGGRRSSASGAQPMSPPRGVGRANSFHLAARPSPASAPRAA